MRSSAASKPGMVAVGILTIAFVLTMSEFAIGQTYVYPGKGQSGEQQKQDEFECYQWARQQTGFDPQQPSSAPPQQQARRGGLFRDAARGAAVGAVGGAIAGDAGKGAAIGAASGALIGGFRRRGQRRQQQQMAQQQASQSQNARGEFDRAYGACLAGRGYTVR